MAGKTNINGTGYTVKGGKTSVGGTGYAIRGGKTKIGGTGYTISFYPDWYSQLKALAVGGTIVIDGMTWRVVNKTASAAVLGLDVIYSTTQFGSNSTYAGSKLAAAASDFEANKLTADTKALLNSVTVKNVTGKVFVPTVEQFFTTGTAFSYYAAGQYNRPCKYNGVYTTYWTSSGSSSSEAYTVYSTGERNTSGASYSHGFRPHIEVNLTL